MKNKIIISILLMSVVQMGTVVISSILSSVAGAFPGTPDATVQFLMTFPSLTVLASSVVSAPLAGRIPKKYIAAVGGFLFALSGVLSWLIHSSLAVLFVWSGIMGVGIGFVVPMATSLIADCFDEDKQPRLMGWQSAASNAGGMIMTFVGGWLAEGHWSLTYLVYLIALPGAVLALLFVPKVPRPVSDPTNFITSTPGDGNILKAIIKKPVLLAFIAAFFGTMLYNNVPANISMFLSEKGLGSSGAAGLASALLLMASAISGIFFGRIASKIKGYVVALGFAAMAVGELIIAFASSLALIYIGCLIGGMALSLIMPQKMFDATQCPGVRSEVATMLTLAGSYLGSFATPVLTTITGWVGSTSVSGRLILSSVIAVCCAAATVISVKMKKS